MPASYPGSVKVFTTKVTGQIIEASHVNELQDEVTAIEQGLLQGLAHALVPDTTNTRDIGSTTRTWRDILAKRFIVNSAGESWRIQVVGTDTWMTVNAYHDGTNWVRDDTTKPSRAIVVSGAGKDLTYLYVGAGTGPITWAQHAKLNSSGQLEITPTAATPPFILGTNAQGQLVTGLNADQVDGQHLADLDGRYVNVTGDTMTGALNAPNVVVGTDPGGTEALRAQNARIGSTTFIGTVTASGQIVTAGTIIAGTDPGGTEALRAQNARIGSTTFTGSVTASGQTVTANTVIADTVIAGTDPGGTEALRAGSARLNAPVLLGSVPQFTMVDDPTSALQVATKQYVDNLTRYDTVQSNGTALTQRRILNATTGLVATDDATNGRTNMQVADAVRQRSIMFVVPGSPTAAVAPATARVIVPFDCTVTAVRSTCRVAVSSGTYTYDLNKNGTTMYTTQANRPTRVSTDGTNAKTHTLPNVTSIAAGDVLDVDVDTVGSGIQDFALFVEVLVS